MQTGCDINQWKRESGFLLVSYWYCSSVSILPFRIWLCMVLNSTLVGKKRFWSYKRCNIDSKLHCHSIAKPWFSRSLCWQRSQVLSGKQSPGRVNANWQWRSRLTFNQIYTFNLGYRQCSVNMAHLRLLFPLWTTFVQFWSPTGAAAACRSQWMLPFKITIMISCWCSVQCSNRPQSITEFQPTGRPNGDHARTAARGRTTDLNYYQYSIPRSKLSTHVAVAKMP
jgi:hypothetical protein